MIRPILAAVLIAGLSGACKGDGAAAGDDAAARPALSAEAVAALERVAAVDLTVPAGGPAECAEYQVAAGPALADIDQRLAAVAADPATAAAASTWLATRAAELGALEPVGSELPRLHRELAALLADVADALAQAAPAAGRLDNAADNLETTLAAMTALCTAP